MLFSCTDFDYCIANFVLFLFCITVLQEIEDRKGFLDEMEELGQGPKYRTIISTEISQVECQTVLHVFKIINYLIFFSTGNNNIQSALSTVRDRGTGGWEVISLQEG